jgi:glutathione S-transferase
MSDLTIIIGNKNYSSWSLRAWLALKHTGADFDEILIALDLPDTLQKLQENSPTAKVPVLKTPDGDIWDSLAIAEYLAESFPTAGLWPNNPAARAHARAVSAEMHSGFVTVRTLMPMDLRSTLPMPEPTGALDREISRLDSLWQECREKFGQDGPFLYGAFTIADCMFAPVVGRFASYSTDISAVSKAYIQAVLKYPGMAEWIANAREEPWIIEQ